MKIVTIKKFSSAEYEVYKKIECGIVLTGSEVKAIRQNNINIKNSYCIFQKQDFVLINCFIKCYMLEKCEETRSRKLLLNKKELLRFKQKSEQLKLISFPGKVYWSKSNKIKIEVVFAKKLKKYEKRSKIKEKEMSLEIRNDLWKK